MRHVPSGPAHQANGPRTCHDHVFREDPARGRGNQPAPAPCMAAHCRVRCTHHPNHVRFCARCDDDRPCRSRGVLKTCCSSPGPVRGHGLGPCLARVLCPCSTCLSSIRGPERNLCPNAARGCYRGRGVSGPGPDHSCCRGRGTGRVPTPCRDHGRGRGGPCPVRGRDRLRDPSQAPSSCDSWWSPRLRTLHVHALASVPVNMRNRDESNNLRALHCINLPSAS